MADFKPGELVACVVDCHDEGGPDAGELVTVCAVFRGHYRSGPQKHATAWGVELHGYAPSDGRRGFDALAFRRLSPNESAFRKQCANWLARPADKPSLNPARHSRELHREPVRGE